MGVDEHTLRKHQMDELYAKHLSVWLILKVWKTLLPGS